jgi:hypothetical protein
LGEFVAVAHNARARPQPTKVKALLRSISERQKPAPKQKVESRKSVTRIQLRCVIFVVELICASAQLPDLTAHSPVEIP